MIGNEPLTRGQVRRGQSVAGTAVRRHNLALVMTLIADSQDPMSRAGLAVATGMTRATAGSLVDQLIEGGLVRELARGPAAVGAPAQTGRPATGLLVNGPGVHGLGLEINVDYLAATLIDAAGRVRYREVVTQDQRDLPPADVLARLARLAERGVVAANGRPVGGAALAVPGLVDRGTGSIRSAPNLGWSNVDALAGLAGNPALAGISLRLGNEADYSAVAELSGPQPPQGDFVLVSGEIGIGAGIVVGGSLFTGGHGWGGEIGHVTVAADGPACACGSRGCLEQYAGQEAILRAAGVARSTATSLARTPTVPLIVERAQADDAAMLAALAGAGEALGIAVSGVLNTLDIPTVVLAGSYAPLARWLIRGLIGELERRVIWSRWLRPSVTVSRQRPGAACLGAAMAVLRSIIDDPAAWLDRPHRPETGAD